MKTILALTLSALLLGCSGDADDGRFAFDANFAGLQDLGPLGGVYEGWALVEGIPISTGRFVIDDAFAPPRITTPDGQRVYGTTDSVSFGPASTQLGSNFPLMTQASHFFVTIEGTSDVDGVPSDNVVLAGPIIDEEAMLTFGGLRAENTPANPDYSTAEGSVVWERPSPLITFPPSIATPNSALPRLPEDGYTYEGWLIDPVSGDRYSTGKFWDPNLPDFDAFTSQANAPFQDVPGGLFLAPRTLGESEVLDLASGEWRTFVTIEGRLDDSLLPSPHVILRADIPTTAVTAAGVSEGPVTMDSAVSELPQLSATITAGAITLSGTPPRGLRAFVGPRWTLFAVIGGQAVRVSSFVWDEVNDVVFADNGFLFSLGTSASFVINSVAVPGLDPMITQATELFISREAVTDTVPRGGVFMAGDVVAGVAALEVSGTPTRAAVADFTMAAGEFILSTPTNNEAGSVADDGFGIWWLNPLSGQPGLVLPSLGDQWCYEGFVENTVTGAIWSTGRFRGILRGDEDHMTWPGRGTFSVGPAVPGQDFVQANAGTVVPALGDLAGFTCSITLEPFPDGSVAPSSVILLQGVLPNQMTSPVVAPLANGFAFAPTGMISFRNDN